MKRIFLVIFSLLIIIHSGFCQDEVNQDIRILFHGMIMDASSLSPIINSQIIINRSFSSVSGDKGTFSFYVHRNDTVLFKSLGYKSTVFYISDTLTGNEFLAGIYMHSDTLLIGEVVIIPRLKNLKSEILNARTRKSSDMENARYNVAISAYQGRNNQSKLGDATANYSLLTQQQKVDAYERGGIPSDRIVGISPLLLLPAAYLLLHGVPEKPAPFNLQLTDQEVDQIQKKYLQTLK